jgi:uncharacterized protein involved in exopolysaccharide biosynthesis
MAALSEHDELSLLDIWRVIVAGRYWVVAITMLATIACASWAYLSTTIYRSSTVLVPANVDRSMGGGSSALGQFGGLASLAGINIDTRDSQIEEALAVLQSREFIEKFISDHNLLPILFPKKWDARNKQWSVSEAKVPTPWKGYRYFVERVLSIDRDRKSGLITVSVDWRSRPEAAAWANEIVERANTEMRVRALAAAAASTQYLEKEREQTQLVETRAAINHLIESEIRKQTMASVTKEYAFRVVDRALPADVDDIWKPKRVLLLILGVIGGLIFGIIVVLSRFGFHGPLSGRPGHVPGRPSEDT